MKTNVTFPYTTPPTSFEVDVQFAHTKVGYGQYNILADVTYLGKSQQFRHYMTDSTFIDEVEYLETNEQAQTAYSQYLHHFEEQIAEWCMDVQEGGS